MTFREAIQIQIEALQEVYDNANNLRDLADENEKELFNNVRRYLPAIWGEFQKIDNGLSLQAAAYVVNGDYSIKIPKEAK